MVRFLRRCGLSWVRLVRPNDSPLTPPPLRACPLTLPEAQPRLGEPVQWALVRSKPLVPFHLGPMSNAQCPLPLEVCTRMMGWLTPAEAVASGGVCRQWRQAAWTAGRPARMRAAGALVAAVLGATATTVAYHVHLEEWADRLLQFGGQERNWLGPDLEMHAYEEWQGVLYDWAGLGRISVLYDFGLL